MAVIIVSWRWPWMVHWAALPGWLLIWLIQARCCLRCRSTNFRRLCYRPLLSHVCQLVILWYLPTISPISTSSMPIAAVSISFLCQPWQLPARRPTVSTFSLLGQSVFCLICHSHWDSLRLIPPSPIPFLLFSRNVLLPVTEPMG